MQAYWYVPYIVAAVIFIISLAVTYAMVLKKEFKDTAECLRIEKQYRERYDDSRYIITLKGLNNYKSSVTDPKFRYNLKNNILSGNTDNKPPVSVVSDFDILAFVKKQTPINHRYSKTLADNWMAEGLSRLMGNSFKVRYDDKDLIISDNVRLNDFYEEMKPYIPEEPENENTEE